MKKFTIMTILTMLLLVACGTTTLTTTKTPKTLKIGWVGPLTGDATTYGIDDKNGAILALEDINSAGGINGQKLEIVFEDGKCTGKDAMTAINKLINVDKVNVVLGGSCSGETLGMAPIAEENEVILITSLSTNPKIRESGDFIFRSIPNDDSTGKELAGLAADKYKRIAIITEATDYAQGIREVFNSRLKELGIELVSDEIFQPGETDYRTHLTKIKEVNPEAVFINPQADPAAGRILKQAAELGIEAQFYMAYYGSSKVVKENAGPELLEGLIWVDLQDIDTSNTKGREILKRHETEFGQKSNFNIWPVTSYDKTRIIGKALEACGDDAKCIRDWLYNMPAYDGITGKIKFDEDGEVVGLTLATYTYKTGEMVKIN